MGISFFKMRKWISMILGKSIYHVNQGCGLCYSKDEIKGYYNNLIEKVTRYGSKESKVPITTVDTGENIYFSIAVFQYGLGAYDLYLMNQDKTMLEKTIACADWAVENQQSDGGWLTFAFKNPEHPYSSMAQGEGISLLIRAHIETKDEKYLMAFLKAKDFMLKPICEGGTTLYSGNDVYFYEYTNVPLILNGWIFSLWGLFDYCKYTNDLEAKKVLDASLTTLKKKLPVFDTKYWSKYDEGKRISSPFYHKLHIAQLKVMYDLFGDSIYKEYADKWQTYLHNIWNPKIAFLIKAVQKVFEHD